jgi:hypothetical protein
MATVPTPKRGEVWLVRFDPSAGAAIRKLRPAVVVNLDAIGGRLPLRIVVPVTDSKSDFGNLSWFVFLPAWSYVPSAWQFTMSPSASPYVPLGLPKLLGQFTMSPRPPQNFSRQHTVTDFCYSLQPAQKLGLLGGKLFLRQDAFALQVGQLLDLCVDIRFLSRVGAVWLGWCLCLCRGVLDHAINGDDGQARDRDGPVLTGEGERAS